MAETHDYVPSTIHMGDCAVCGHTRESHASEKPLFIPLKTVWFRMFQSGEKDTEYRAYGPRWNERTCRIGRRVVVSHGYGKHERLNKTVRRFTKLHYARAPAAAKSIYPNAEWIAAIELH